MTSSGLILKVDGGKACTYSYTLALGDMSIQKQKRTGKGLTRHRYRTTIRTIDTRRTYQKQKGKQL